MPGKKPSFIPRRLIRRGLWRFSVAVYMAILGLCLMMALRGSQHHTDNVSNEGLSGRKVLWRHDDYPSYSSQGGRLPRKPSSRNTTSSNRYGFTNLENTVQLLSRHQVEGMDGLRVLFVTGGFRGPTKFGGIGAAFYREADLLRSSGAQITVLYTAQVRGIEPWIDFFEKENITFVPLQLIKPNPYGSVWMVRSYSVYRWLKPREKHFDIVLFHDIYGMSLYSMYAKKAGIAFHKTPLVIHGHGATKLSNHFNARAPKDHNTLVLYFMEKKAIESADFVTVPSDFYAEWMLENNYKLNRQTTLTMQNMVEINTVQKFNLPGTVVKSQHLCFFSRLDSLKGAFFMSQTLLYMSEENMNLPQKFTFIGDPVKIDGEMSDHLLIKQLNGSAINFKILTNLNTEQALAFMNREKCILIIPSFGEAGPLVLYESVNAGLPVIYSDIQAITDQLHDNLPAELRFKPGDEAGLARALQHAMIHGVPVQGVIVDPGLSKTNYRKLIPYIMRNTQVNKLDSYMIPRYTVTVIITSHNRADTLKDLLVALLQQTFRYFKVLIMDCSSNNEAMEVAQAMAATFEDSSIIFSFMRIEPVYVSQVRNSAMRQIDTAYGIFIDDDDIPTPNMVELFMLTAIRTNADSVTGIARNFQEDKAGVNTRVKYSLAVGGALEAELFFHYAGKSNMLIRKDVYQAVGGCTVVTEGQEAPYVDWDLYIKLLLHGYTLEVVPEPTFEYRINSKNSIYYQSTGKGRKIYHGHHKMVTNFCKFHDFPADICDALIYAKFSLSLPRIIDFGG